MNGKQSKKLRALAQAFDSLPVKPNELKGKSLEQIYEHLKLTHKLKPKNAIKKNSRS